MDLIFDINAASTRNQPLVLCLQDKIEVNGKNTHPVYKILKEGQPQDLPGDFMVPGEKGKITWNYTSEP